MDVVANNTTLVLEYTVHGHILGMLDRDQRTTTSSARTRCRSAVLRRAEYSNETCQCPTTENTQQTTRRHHHQHQQHQTLLNRRHNCTSTRDSLRRRLQGGKSSGNYLRETLRRLKEVLIVGTYLLSIVCIPSSLSAPTSRLGSMEDRMKERMETNPNWINPCGMTEDSMPHDTQMYETITETQLSKQINNQANIALSEAIIFRDDYVRTVFNKEYKSPLDMVFPAKRYSWLPSLEQIPKNLGEPTPTDHLNTLKMDEALLDIYGYLQRIAVGLEQIVWDQEDQSSGNFKKNFEQSAAHLKSVLCEIQGAILELNVPMRPDVTRDIMPDNFRKMNETERTVRDWFIYRDYMNALQYVGDVFKHFERITQT